MNFFRLGLLIPLALFLLSETSVRAKLVSGSLEWEQRYQRTNPYVSEQPAGVGTDSAGNVFATSGSRGTSSSRDFYTVKYAATGGQILWEKRYDGTGADEDIPHVLGVDANGDVIVAGSSFATNSNSDLVVLKYAGSDGALLWEQRVTRPVFSGGTLGAIAFDAEGNVFVTGTTASGANASESDALTVKLFATTGAVLWQKTYAGVGDWNDGGRAIAVDRDGNVAIAGHAGTRDQGYIVDYDFFAAKYSGADGTLIWERTIGLGYAFTVGVDGAGNVIAAGVQGGMAYAVKFAAGNGAILWERHHGGPIGTAMIAALEVDVDGDVFVGGYEATSVPPGPNAILPKRLRVAKHAGADGRILWQTSAGPDLDSNTAVVALTVDGYGNPVITGTGIEAGQKGLLMALYSGSTGSLLWSDHQTGAFFDMSYRTKSGLLAVAPDDSIAVAAPSKSDGAGTDMATLKYRVVWLDEPVIEPATNIGSRTARLTGTVTSAGVGPQTASFKEVLGELISAFSTPAIEITGAAGSDVKVVAELTDLRPHTTYQFSLVTEVQGRKLLSKRLSFSTLNAQPAASDDSFIASGSLEPSTLDVLGNDSDADDDTLTITSVSRASYGTVTIQGQKIVYTPAALHDGTDEFTYTVGDGFGGSATATVRISRPQTLAVAARRGAANNVFILHATKTLTASFFGTPSIDAAGGIRMLAHLRGDTGDVRSAIVNEQRQALISAGEMLPGDSGAKFVSFKEPMTDESGRIAFVARLNGRQSRAALFTNSFSGETAPSLSRVAEVGEHAPGTPAEARWSQIVSAALLDSGTVPFVGKLKTGRGNVTANNDLGLWMATGEGTTLVLREGQEVEIDGKIRKVRAFDALTSVKGSPGHGRLAVNAVPVRMRFRDGGSAVMVAAVDELDLRALSGEPAAGTDGFEFASFGIPALNHEGRMAFAAELRSGQKRSSGVFADRGDEELLLIASQGSDAPEAGGAKFRTFHDPVYNAQEHVAFIATLTAGKGTGGATKGIWWRGSGDLKLVARTGDSAPGIDGATFTSFTSLALPDSDGAGPIFVAQVKIVESRARKTQRVEHGRGLWAVGADGILRLVVREGDTVAGKKLKKFSVLSAVSGSPAQSRSYNSEQQLVYSAYFEDGTQSIVKIKLP